MGYDKVFEVEDKLGLENQYLGRGGGMVGWVGAVREAPPAGEEPACPYRSHNASR